MIWLELFWTFFKIGLFTFGGGYAMLPLIQDEVFKHDWLNMTELVNFIAVSESTPGSFAVNISTYVGKIAGGPVGAFCATLGVVLPSMLVILIIGRFYEKFKNSVAVRGVMAGLRPAVVGMIAAALLSVAQEVFFPEETGSLQQFSVTPVFCVSVLIFGTMTVLAFRKRHPILLIGLSALIGIAAGYLLDLPCM